MAENAVDHPSFVGYRFKRLLVPVPQVVMSWVLEDGWRRRAALARHRPRLGPVGAWTGDEQRRPAAVPRSTTGDRDSSPPCLSEMTLEELWRIFPIVLRRHDPAYGQWFEQVRHELQAQWGPLAVRISHIGSTAVPGLLAKPTVDILLELSIGVAPRQALERLIASGWTRMSGDVLEPMRLAMNRGYTPRGYADRVFHLHVRHPGDPDELYFRDYLIDHSDVRDEYGALKRGLQMRFEHDREAYTEAKTPFIRAATARARAQYGPRHALGREPSGAAPVVPHGIVRS
ncbi:GrpB family protein [Schaalia naturae]|uniref:GrpB family protein n=1 Tax=Schaalia naturae TaxID=635203 RepID=A0ABW2SLI7_9ACTO